MTNDPRRTVHPQDLERVTVDSVRACLDAAGVRHDRIRPVRHGVVRVDVTGATAARRHAAQSVVLAVLDGKFAEHWWRSYPVGRVYP